MPGRDIESGLPLPLTANGLALTEGARMAGVLIAADRAASHSWYTVDSTYRPWPCWEGQDPFA